MLYGIRRDLQAALVASGYRVRIYIPFGRQWFPYFMRRLGERPANVAFVLRSILADRGDLDRVADAITGRGSGTPTLPRPVTMHRRTAAETPPSAIARTTAGIELGTPLERS